MWRYHPSFPLYPCHDTSQLPSSPVTLSQSPLIRLSQSLGSLPPKPALLPWHLFL